MSQATQEDCHGKTCAWPGPQVDRFSHQHDDLASDLTWLSMNSVAVPMLVDVVGKCTSHRKASVLTFGVMKTHQLTLFHLFLDPAAHTPEFRNALHEVKGSLSLYTVHQILTAPLIAKL